jgi:hypothetical protein
MVTKNIKGDLTYSPAQGWQILDDQGNDVLLANLKGYLQDLLLVWFYFSITKDQQSQRRDIFLDLFQCLTRR